MKKVIKEADIVRIIKEGIDEYNRAYEIQQAKAELGDFMKKLIGKYRLKNAEQWAVLKTIVNYYCPAYAEGLIK